MTLQKTDASPYRYTCVYRLYQDNNKMLKLYARILWGGKRKKSYTSVKPVVYPKQLLPLSYISRPYWRTSDTLLTFRSINNYCSLWDAERGFREFTGKRRNLPAAVKQLQHNLSPRSPPLSTCAGRRPACCPTARRTLATGSAGSPGSFLWQAWLRQGFWTLLSSGSPTAIIHLNYCFISLQRLQLLNKIRSTDKFASLQTHK